MTTKKVISIELIVACDACEPDEWRDRWLECDDENVHLPYELKDCIPVLADYDIILVGNKWFPGKDAKAAITEAIRVARNDGITLVDEKGKTIAEIYDVIPFMKKDDPSKYHFMNQECGNIEHSLEDIAESGDYGHTYLFSWKGW